MHADRVGQAEQTVGEEVVSGGDGDPCAGEACCAGFRIGGQRLQRVEGAQHRSPQWGEESRRLQAGEVHRTGHRTDPGGEALGDFTYRVVTDGDQQEIGGGQVVIPAQRRRSEVGGGRLRPSRIAPQHTNELMIDVQQPTGKGEAGPAGPSEDEIHRCSSP